MRTVPALLVFLLLFGFTACGRKLQNDTDIGNTAAVSSEDRPDKGKLSGDKGQAGQADQADQTDQTNQEMSGPLAKKETQKIQKEQKALPKHQCFIKDEPHIGNRKEYAQFFRQNQDQQTDNAAQNNYHTRKAI